MNLSATLKEIARAAPSDANTRQKFLRRIARGKISRDGNPTSHVCAYFAAYDPSSKRVFIGHHRKSGLWLFNGGHIDRGEPPIEAIRREMDEEWGFTIRLPRNTRPQLLTLTRITKNPTKRACRWHYDIWYFVPVRRTRFAPKAKLLAGEYFTTGWKTISEARRLSKDPNTGRALRHIQRLLTPMSLQVGPSQLLAYSL